MMRAARLLQILLLLQNRGRLSSAQLAEELEVSRRTILRDVDAITEAGLPVIMYQGNQGGVELGFNYRTRLTGLAEDEAEALGVLLNHPLPALDALNMREAATRARSKLIESLPDGVRHRIALAQKQFSFSPQQTPEHDPRIKALAEAVRNRCAVKINAHSSDARTIHPHGLVLGPAGWSVIDGLAPDSPIPLITTGSISISAKQFE